jgi:hypothetical protein
MFFIESLIATFLLFLVLSHNLISDYRLIAYVMLVFFIFSLIPSLTIPYVSDDLDYFYYLARSLDSHQVIQWLMTPANEHVIFLEKIFYLFCYKIFWLNPEFFHMVIVVVCLGIITLIYRLIFVLTQSPLAALIGASIMASSNLTDEAIFVCTNSFIFFCIFLFLLLFYAIHRYADTQKSHWRTVAFFSILMASVTFASGLTSIIFVLLFYRLCLSQDLRQKGKNLFPLLLIGWLLSLIPFFYFMNDIIFAKHYQYVGATSAFGAARILLPICLLSKYVIVILIPSLSVNHCLSFGLFFLCFFIAIQYNKVIDWKRILFFVVFGLFNTFIIYVFRSKALSEDPNISRYSAFPLIMMAFSYALILDVFIKQKRQINNVSIDILIYLLCFFAVVNGSLYRYSKGDQFYKKTVFAQYFYVNFRNAFVDYFHTHDLKYLQFKNVDIACPMSRFYWRSREFYTQFILPSSINKKIIWSKKTDPEFLKYLISHRYLFLTDGE